MTTSVPTNSEAAEQPGEPEGDPRAGDEPWAALAAWAADELHAQLAFDGKRYRLEESPPEEPRRSADVAASESTIRRSWFRRRPPKDETPAAPEPFTTETPAEVLAELVRRLRSRDAPAAARPLHQPMAVHDLAAKLFEAYTLDGGGQAHLAGCHLEDVPLVRLTQIDDAGDSPVVTHRYFDELGEPVAWAQVEALGANRVAPVSEPAPRLDAGRLARMLESAARSAGEAFDARLATIVYAKRASGRLRFEFGDESLDTPFEGWARTLDAPAVVCPHTGEATFRLAATDDGRIVAADQIVVSGVTGRRVLEGDLERCVATGKLAEPEHLGACAASGDAVLRTELTACDRCGLKVKPAAKHAGGCDACRGAEALSGDAELKQRIAAAHPGLAKGRWQVSQTEHAYLLEASGWLRRHAVTLDRESLAVLHAAEASRFSSVWRPLPRDYFDR